MKKIKKSKKINISEPIPSVATKNIAAIPPKAVIISGALILLGIGFFIGWLANNKSSEIENKLRPLRLSGYEYIRPLLACDTEKELASKKTENLQESLNKYISSEISQGNISNASVYVRDYNDGTSFTVNSQEKYYPASLNKIPVMIAAYEMAQNNKAFLDQKFLWDDPTNYNQGIEIQPKNYLKSGQSYSISEAIDAMIKYSDNNAFFFLTKHLDIELYKKIYRDLRITYSKDTTDREDYMTVKEYSYFLRVLFNATYIDKDLSEKALSILSEVDYKNGIAAGLPKDIKIAHKFGITASNEAENSRKELHDCGVVYTKTPYLICAMTKGTVNIKKNEDVIKNISSMVYESINN